MISISFDHFKLNFHSSITFACSLVDRCKGDESAAVQCTHKVPFNSFCLSEIPCRLEIIIIIFMYSNRTNAIQVHYHIMNLCIKFSVVVSEILMSCMCMGHNGKSIKGTNNRTADKCCQLLSFYYCPESWHAIRTMMIMVIVDQHQKNTETILFNCKFIPRGKQPPTHYQNWGENNKQGRGSRSSGRRWRMRILPVNSI